VLPPFAIIAGEAGRHLVPATRPGSSEVVPDSTAVFQAGPSRQAACTAEEGSPSPERDHSAAVGTHEAGATVRLAIASGMTSGEGGRGCHGIGPEAGPDRDLDLEPDLDSTAALTRGPDLPLMREPLPEPDLIPDSDPARDFRLRHSHPGRRSHPRPLHRRIRRSSRGRKAASLTSSEDGCLRTARLVQRRGARSSSFKIGRSCLRAGHWTTTRCRPSIRLARRAAHPSRRRHLLQVWEPTQAASPLRVRRRRR